MKKHFIICSYCGNKKERFRKSNKKINFCNASCQLKYEYKNKIRNKTEIVKKAQEAVIKKSIEKFKINPTTKIGKRGYLEIYIPQKRWKKYHHYIWEKYNKPISKNYVIHHIDRNRFNNNINNLIILTNSEHSKIHDKDRERDNSGKFI